MKKSKKIYAVKIGRGWLGFNSREDYAIVPKYERMEFPDFISAIKFVSRNGFAAKLVGSRGRIVADTPRF